jgi:hypothetical protein
LIAWLGCIIRQESLELWSRDRNNGDDLQPSLALQKMF